jgi:hypothetical protein
LIRRLVERVRRSARSLGILVCVDGFASYVSAFKKAFRVRVHTGKRGRPREALAKGFMLGQVVKRSARRRVVEVTRRIVEGEAETIRAVVRATRGEHARRKPRSFAGETGEGPAEGHGEGPEDGAIHTSYIERLNATFRSRLALLVRRGRAIAHTDERLEGGLFVVGSVYNFCTPHSSMREDAPSGARSKTGVAIRWHPRTPAMAAGLTDHVWTPLELFSYRVPPAPPPPPPRRGRRLKPPLHPACAGLT